MSKRLRQQVQRGFTLIEVMVAASLSVFVTLAATAILVQAVAVADLITSKVRINQEARLLLGQLLDGATIDRNGDGAIAAGESIPGFHGGMVPLTAPGATAHTCPMQSRFGTSIVVANHRLTVPDVYPTIAVDLVDRIGLSSSIPGTARVVACFAADNELETVGPWAVATTQESLETLGREGAVCPTAASTATVNGLVSAYEPDAADSGLGTAVQTNPGAADDFWHLRLDIVDFSLLVPVGEERKFNRRQHTESFMVQVRCQREFFGT